MMVLSAATDKLQVVTDAAADVEVSGSWVRASGSPYAVAASGPLALANITTATTTDLRVGPGGGAQDAIPDLSLRNAHASTTVNVTVQVTDGTTTSSKMKVALLAGESLQFGPTGWVHKDSNGGDYPALGNLAVQADMEGASSTTVVVTPGVLKYHPGVCKAWVKAGVTGNILASYNITSLTDTGTGVLGITIDVDFSSADYCVNVSIEATATTWAVANTRECHIRSATMALGSVSVDCVDNTATTSLVKDPTSWHVSMYGDQ